MLLTVYNKQRQYKKDVKKHRTNVAAPESGCYFLVKSVATTLNANNLGHVEENMSAFTCLS